MLIKIFICGNDGYESLRPIGGEDFTVALYRLPRGYSLEIDSDGTPYILCPNKEKVYEIEQSRRRSNTVKICYNAGGKMRQVRLHLDEKATHEMIFSGEEYRVFP